MPPIDHYAHIVGWFTEVGPAAAGMGGNTPITYTEVMNWATMMGVEISHFELDVLMRMSKQYCYQSYKSDDSKCEPPYEVQLLEEEKAQMREIAEEKIRGLF